MYFSVPNIKMSPSLTLERVQSVHPSSLPLNSQSGQKKHVILSFPATQKQKTKRRNCLSSSRLSRKRMLKFKKGFPGCVHQHLSIPGFGLKSIREIHREMPAAPLAPVLKAGPPSSPLLLQPCLAFLLLLPIFPIQTDQSHRKSL